MKEDKKPKSIVSLVDRLAVKKEEEPKQEVQKTSGQLEIDILPEGGNVVMRFSRPAASITLSPKQAHEIARSLVNKSKFVKSTKKVKIKKKAKK